MKKSSHNTIVVEGNPSWMPESLRSREQDLEILVQFSAADKENLQEEEKNNR